MRYRYVFHLILALISADTWGQFTAEGFLSSSLSDAEMKEILDSEEFLKENRFASPWVRELEFRGKSDDREIGIEDYRLRLGLMNPREIVANKRYKVELDKTLVLRKKARLNKVLRQRYLLLIDHMYLSAQILNVSRLTNYFEDALAEIYASEGKDVPEDAMDMEERLTKEQLDLGDLRRDLEVVSYLIRERFSFEGEIRLDTSGMTTPNDIRLHLERILQTETNFYSSLNQQRGSLDETRLAVEKGESFRNIGFFQIDYDTQRGNELNEHLGYRFGITLPLVNPDKPDLQRDRMDIIEASAERELEDVERTRETRLLQLDLESNLLQMDLVKARLLQLQVLIEMESEPGKGFRRKAIEYETYLIGKWWKSYADTLEGYIRLLQMKGQLVVNPLVNYLSKDLNPIEIEY